MTVSVAANLLVLLNGGTEKEVIFAVLPFGILMMPDRNCPSRVNVSVATALVRPLMVYSPCHVPERTDDPLPPPRLYVNGLRVLCIPAPTGLRR